MALTGLQIYKLLPQTNCGDCGPPTCLAFAMQLAQGKGSLDDCPHASDEAKDALGAAAAPPIKLVTIGTGDNKVEVGDETVMFRHDKTFFHETALAVKAKDTLSDDDFRALVEKINSLSFERIGMILSANMVAVVDESGDPDTFCQRAVLAGELTDLPLGLFSENPEAIKKALEELADRNPLVYGGTEDNIDEIAPVVAEHGVPLGIRAEGLDSLAALSKKAQEKGVQDLLLDPGRRHPAQALEDFTQIRRQAIKKNFRPLGFPTIAFPSTNDMVGEAMDASIFICKYGSVVVLEHAQLHQILPLVVLRQNIYTDPQKPIQVEPKVYEIGAPDEDAPVYLTTNFSLTYFSVMSEIEASKQPSYLLIVDTEGTSVLTAWAAGKFDAEKITEAIKSSGVEDRVSHRKLIIPGHVSILSGKIQEESGWEVMVGPREATGIPAYVRKNWESA